MWLTFVTHITFLLGSAILDYHQNIRTIQMELLKNSSKTVKIQDDFFRFEILKPGKSYITR